MGCGFDVDCVPEDVNIRDDSFQIQAGNVLHFSGEDLFKSYCDFYLRLWSMLHFHDPGG